MIILAVDSSGDTLKVAVLSGQQTQAEIVRPATNRALELLIPSINDLLESSYYQLRDVDLFTVVIGPGSWSGLRIGVSTMKTLSRVSNIPIIGVPTLDAIAFNLRYVQYPVYVAMDARKDRLFYAEYDCTSEAPMLVSETLPKRIDEFASLLKEPSIILPCGNEDYRQALSRYVSSGVTIAPGHLGCLRPATVAEAGHRSFHNHGPDNAASLAPLYLQEFKTTPPRKSREARVRPEHS